MRVDRLAGACSNVGLNLAPILSVESYRLDEALMLIICPVAVASPALMSETIIDISVNTELGLGHGFNVAFAHLIKTTLGLLLLDQVLQVLLTKRLQGVLVEIQL